MNSVWVVTSALIDHEDLRRLVEALGGRWNGEQTLDEGVIERGRATIYISEDKELCPSFYDQSEISSIYEKLGAEARGVISIQVGHGEGSPRLAAEFVEEVLSKWGGVLDGEIEVLPRVPDFGKSGT